ncbi:MAG: hypothetical protein IJ772_03805 [Bacilli bacterium]|nr:hypothetical protein [Bacilli bacterium]MBR1817955.1 hypothetical protein [Bacilli bacterium]
MKKTKLFILVLLLSVIIPVQAKECHKITESSLVNILYSDTSNVDITIEGTNYPAGTLFAQIPYCDVSSNEKMDNGACWSFAVSNILRSFGSDVYSEQFAEYFCNNPTYKEALRGTNNYSGITLNPEIHDYFHMNIENISQSMQSLDQTLDEGKAVLASISGTRVFAESGAGHYIAILMKKDNQYYVANSSVTVKRGWVDRSVVESEVINKIGQGLYAVSPTDCISLPSQSQSASGSSSSSSSSSTGSGLQNDEYKGNGFKEIETEDITCRNVFMKADGELNELGEFVQGLFTLIKIAAPALVIILSTIDYVKAIVNSDDSEMKKVTSKVIKRIIFGVIVFLLPFLLDLLFHLFGLYDLSTCGIGTNGTNMPVEED